MERIELKKGEVYYLPATGNVVYCGITDSGKMMLVRDIKQPKVAIYLPTAIEHGLREPCCKPEKICAYDLRLEQLLFEGDSVFFLNKSGAHFGTISKVERHQCYLTVKGITKPVSLRLLYKYDNFTRQLPKQDALRAKNNRSDKHQISDNSRACAL